MSDDTRDMSWLGGEAPPPPVYPEHTVWRVEKDTRWAEARIREVPHGRELRFVIGGVGREEVLMHSNVFRDAQALADYSTGMRQTFTAKGWELVPEAPSA